MNNKMKLSIITVNLNNADGLRKTIESVVHQTYTHFEHIIIDGGSSDGSVEVIKEYENKYAHIQGGLYWISEPDKGIYNGMNKGIKVAKGEYCLFLNSGDCLHDYELLKDIKLSKNYDLIYGNIVFDNGKNKVKHIKQVPQLSLSLFINTTIMHSACFINKQLFTSIGLYNEDFVIISDWCFFVDAYLTGNLKYKYINRTISIFDTNGISSDPKFEEQKKMEKKTYWNSKGPLIEELYEEIENLKLIKNEFTLYKLKRHVRLIIYIENVFRNSIRFLGLKDLL